VLPILPQQRYVLITGGGAILLRDLLSERAAAVGKQARRLRPVRGAVCRREARLTMGDRTVAIPVRLTATERARLVALLTHYPELHTISDVLRQALMLGTLLMKVQATRPGQPDPYAGYAVDDLRVLLAPRLLPALAFLSGQGRYLRSGRRLARRPVG
jgi:hypothetical protein